MIATRLLRAVRALVDELTAATQYHTPVRYRVIGAASGERWNLQAVRRGVWPDLLPAVSMPGAAGYRATLQPSSIVLVQFVEGDPTLPVITHFEGPDGSGFIPTAIVIGGLAGSPAARVSDTVSIYFPPAIPVTGTLNGLPFTGIMNIPGPGIGSIQTGSVKVSIA